MTIKVFEESSIKAKRRIAQIPVSEAINFQPEFVLFYYKMKYHDQLEYQSCK